jgi:putative membrane protein
VYITLQFTLKHWEVFMSKSITRYLIYLSTIYLVSYFYEGFHVSSLSALVVFSLVLFLINLIIKPLVQLLTLPITILTMGLFLLVISTLMIMLASSLVNGVYVDGFISAFFVSLLLAILQSLVKSKK